MRVFDSRLQKETEILEMQPGRFGMYVCGPTVYHFIHVGNARPLVVFDVLYRHLRQQGKEVVYVRNITDVDDRIIQIAAGEGVSAASVAQRYEQSFLEDAQALGCLAPTHEPRATQHISEMIQHIEGLIDLGMAYPSNGDVYFSVRAFPDYGQLTRLSLDALSQGERNDMAEWKRDPADFTLWKKAKPGEPSWSSPWGDGRPGWHIECSAMASTYLGKTFDLHGGGIDLRFPHHENEMAQSEGLYGAKSFAKHWVHNGHVGFRWVHQQEVLAEGNKISKSDPSTRHLLGFFLVKTCTDRYSGEAIRLWMLGTHYRSPLAFDIDAPPDHDPERVLVRYPGLEEAERRIEYGYLTMQRLEDISAPVETAGDVVPEAIGWSQRFFEALENDLNTPMAVAEWHQALALANRLMDTQGPAVPKDVRRRSLLRLKIDLRMANESLGVLEAVPSDWLAKHRLRRLNIKGMSIKEVEQRILQRDEARARKDFAVSDALRAALLADGIELMDTVHGTRWRVVDDLQVLSSHE